MQNFWALGAPPPDPQNSPPLRISGYAPGVQRQMMEVVYSSEREIPRAPAWACLVVFEMMKHEVT